MPAIVIIPSRFASSRFPGKPLQLLKGKSMIQHVYERSRSARLVEEVFVATDSPEIFTAVEGFGGRAIMTSDRHQSGTDRIAEAVMLLDKDKRPDIVVNVQGDEPLIMPGMIDSVIGLMGDERAAIGTLSKRIRDRDELLDPNVVKVVIDKDGFALYFSRATVPYYRDVFGSSHSGIKDVDLKTIEIFKHIGIYAYRTDALLAFSKLSPSKLEVIERLEQLRALENGLRIRVGETDYETIGVDTPMDLERVEKCLSSSL